MSWCTSCWRPCVDDGHCYRRNLPATLPVLPASEPDPVPAAAGTGRVWTVAEQLHLLRSTLTNLTHRAPVPILGEGAGPQETQCATCGLVLRWDLSQPPDFLGTPICRDQHGRRIRWAPCPGKPTADPPSVSAPVHPEPLPTSPATSFPSQRVESVIQNIPAAAPEAAGACEPVPVAAAAPQLGWEF